MAALTGTTPDSLSYPAQDYGVLGPYQPNIVSILEFGADPTGVDDSVEAIQAALDAIPDAGGEVVVPPGVYKITDTPLAKSNTVISGSGTIKASTRAEWRGSIYRGLSNENWEASSITDENITIRGITIDMTDLGVVTGGEHGIYIRRAAQVVVENVTLLGGASGVALLGCDDTLVSGCRLVGFRNCGIDHWDNPANARMVGNYLETTISSQMVNFNPEPSSLLGTGHIADGFVMTGNILVSSEATGTPNQIEPLATGNIVRNVTISGNVFKNSYLVARGDVQGMTIADNTFSDFQGNIGAIVCSSQFGMAATGAVISGNIVRDCLAEPPNLGVIYCNSDSVSIVGNSILGTAYTVSAISVGSSAGNAIANYVEKAAYAGKLQGGFRLLNGIDNYVGWLDTNGAISRMALQDSNIWGFWATNSAGGARNVFAMTMASDTSSLVCNVPYQAAGFFYQSHASGLTATGTGTGTALGLTANVNQVATVAAGTGVRLPNQSFYGGDLVVINDGANTLKVYPTTGGSIDSLGTNVGYDLPAGSVGVWTFASGTNWRTKNVFP